MIPKKLKLVSYAICPFVQRATLLMELKGLDYEIEYIDLAEKPDWFLEISPMGKVPLLMVGDTVLFESQAILEFLDEASGESLHHTDLVTTARDRGLAELASNMIFSQWAMLTAESQEEVAGNKEKLLGQLAYLERQLGEGPFFHGAQPHLTDVAFAPMLQRLVFAAEDFVGDLFVDTPRVAAWAKTLLELKALERSAKPELRQLIADRIVAEQGYFAEKAA